MPGTSRLGSWPGSSWRTPQRARTVSSSFSDLGASPAVPNAPVKPPSTPSTAAFAKRAANAVRSAALAALRKARSAQRAPRVAATPNAKPKVGAPPKAKAAAEGRTRPVTRSQTKAVADPLLPHGYKTVGPIAAGAFSTIVRASSVSTGSIVAIKTFDTNKCMKAPHLKLVRDRELQVLRLLRDEGKVGRRWRRAWPSFFVHPAAVSALRAASLAAPRRQASSLAHLCRTYTFATPLAPPPPTTTTTTTP